MSSVLLMFSSKTFIVSGLTFKSLIHFECIFVYGVRKCSNFILLHVPVQFSQNHLLKRLSFSHYSGRWIIEHLAVISVRESSAYVLL